MNGRRWQARAKMLARRVVASICGSFCAYSPKCRRCGMPDRFATLHATPYHEHWTAQALCEHCYQSLTPYQRLPYYKALWISWWRHADPFVPWEVIRTAVMCELPVLRGLTMDEAMSIANENRCTYIIMQSRDNISLVDLIPVLPDQLHRKWRRWYKAMEVRG